MNNKVFHNQPIDLTRGQGWDEAAWAIHEPAVIRAAKKADQGLEYLGIHYDEWKVGVIQNARSSLGEVVSLGGCALNAVNFLIFTEKTEHDRPRAVSNAARWSSTTVHEVIHCTRFEAYSHMNDPIEIAASEGLAYIAQRAYIAKFCAKQVVPQILDYELEEPEPLLLEQLKAIANNHTTNSDALEWAKTTGQGNFVNNGSLIGAQLVQQQINKGFTIPDLMKQPAGDILGL